MLDFINENWKKPQIFDYVDIGNQNLNKPFKLNDDNLVEQRVLSEMYIKKVEENKNKINHGWRYYI